MADALLLTVTPSTPQAEAMAALQRWIKQTVVNAGIALPT